MIGSYVTILIETKVWGIEIKSRYHDYKWINTLQYCWNYMICVIIWWWVHMQFFNWN